jgi:CheY-like chemotaxis protein/Tfp pilus assembly protein PilZ
VDAPKRDIEAPQLKRQKQVLLLVDADIQNRFYTDLVLQRLGYQVFSVKTGEEALVVMEMTAPLAVLTDVTLPQMSGIELLKQIKQGERSRDIPVIFCTAMRDPSLRAECSAAGAAGFLVQPADHNQLYEAVQHATEGTPRRFIRLATMLDVIVEDGSMRKEKVTAISEHGMYVNTDQPLPRGTTVPFVLFLDRSLAWGIRVEGTVLYSRSSGAENTPAGMGVKFTQIRPDDRDQIGNFIQRTLMQGLPPRT